MVIIWQLCSRREKMGNWKTSQPHCGPWSFPVSFTEWQSLCKWPETFQSSWLLGNITSRVAAGTRCATPPGMWLCSKAGLPPRCHLPVLGAGTGQTGGATLFSGNDKLVALIGRESLWAFCSSLNNREGDFVWKELVWRVGQSTCCHQRPLPPGPY